MSAARLHTSYKMLLSKSDTEKSIPGTCRSTGAIYGLATVQGYTVYAVDIQMIEIYLGLLFSLSDSKNVYFRLAIMPNNN